MNNFLTYTYIGRREPRKDEWQQARDMRDPRPRNPRAKRFVVDNPGRLVRFDIT